MTTTIKPLESYGTFGFNSYVHASKLPYTIYHCSHCGVIVKSDAIACGHCGADLR